MYIYLCVCMCGETRNEGRQSCVLALMHTNYYRPYEFD